MEMIAKKMYQTIWVTHNDDLRKLGEELNECLQNNTESPEVISLKKQLEDLNGEMDKLVQGRAQSRISLAEFMKMSTQVNEKVMATEKALQEAERQNSAEEQLDLEKLEASLCDSADFSGGEINEYFLDVYVRRIIKSGERYIWLLSLTEKIKPKPPETKEKTRIQQIRTYKAGELVNPETAPDIVEQKKGGNPYEVPPMRTHGFLLQEGDAKRPNSIRYGCRRANPQTGAEMGMKCRTNTVHSWVLEKMAEKVFAAAWAEYREEICEGCRELCRQQTYSRDSQDKIRQCKKRMAKILKDVAELESAKQEGLVVERAYKALYRSYDTKINREKALPARLQVQRQVPEIGAVFTRRDLFPDKKVSRELWTYLPPATITMPLKSQCILDYIVQLARVKLTCGTAVSQVGGKAAGS